MGIFSKSDSTLKRENENLKSEVAYLRSENARLTDIKADYDIREQQFRTEHKIEIANIQASHDRTVTDLRATIDTYDYNNEQELENLKVELENSAEKSLREEKAKLRKEIEEEKARVRRELRAEFGDKHTQSQNKINTLIEENGKLAGQVEGMKGTIKVLESQIDSMQTLSETLLGALPEVSAHITTPAVAAPANANKGGDQGKK